MVFIPLLLMKKKKSNVSFIVMEIKYNTWI